MFYSTQILSKRGALGTIWIASHMEKRLKRNQIFETSISASVGERRPPPAARRRRRPRSLPAGLGGLCRTLSGRLPARPAGHPPPCRIPLPPGP